jgi:hypothetical protein
MTHKPSAAVAALVASVTLLFGPTVAGCDSAADSNDGTTSNDPADRSGDDPAGVSQGNVPRESDGGESGGQG